MINGQTYLELIKQGKSNEEIAKELSIPVSHVQIMRNHLKEEASSFIAHSDEKERSLEVAAVENLIKQAETLRREIKKNSYQKFGETDKSSLTKIHTRIKE